MFVNSNFRLIPIRKICEYSVVLPKIMPKKTEYIFKVRIHSALLKLSLNLIRRNYAQWFNVYEHLHT